jgi:hypothetical protein
MEDSIRCGTFVPPRRPALFAERLGGWVFAVVLAGVFLDLAGEDFRDVTSGRTSKPALSRRALAKARSS